MAGLKSGAPAPTALTVHEASRVLEVAFSDGASFRIPFELMRVYSPSAEVQGHGPGQEVLQTGKRDVTLVNLEPVGNYAVKPTFSDGHDSGIFSWDYLYEPDAATVIDELLTRYIEALIYQAVAENMASEQSARMVAMKAATDNAGTLIGELKLIYNKTRQAAITKELSEIVGGAAAISG